MSPQSHLYMSAYYTNFLYQDESYRIIGAALNVHRLLGCGFLEAVYGDALALEFDAQGIPFEREKAIDIMYKGQPLSHKYYADFVCYGKIIIELKALNELSDHHYAQVLNYLKASNMKLGLLLNFGEATLKTKRVVL